MLVRLLCLISFILTIAVGSNCGHAQGKRVALVIGNSDYAHATKLENPKNDADDIAAALQTLGFEVVKGVDLDKAAMDRTIRDFAVALTGAKVGLFFYAGHGLQVSGQNYLVPTDAKLATPSGLDFETVRMDLVHRTMERETSTNIIFLDACRDNPLSRNLARAMGTRSASIGKGLAVVESGEGTLISFSTQPGNVALDGRGRNSPFATALVKHITTPGEDLPSILINVRNDVMQSTERRQVPWEHSAMTARFFFSEPKATDDQQAELTLWHSVKDSTDPQAIGAYLRKFPQGSYAVVARTLMTALEKQREMESAARQEGSRQQTELRKAQEGVRKAQEAARAEAPKQAQTIKSASLPEQRSTMGVPFDGIWQVQINCPNTPDGVKAYSRGLFANVKNGVLQGKDGVKEKPLWLEIEGKIEPNGDAALIVSGLTGGDRAKSLGMPQVGTSYQYSVAARFAANQGSGKRISGRECQFTFAKQ